MGILDDPNPATPDGEDCDGPETVVYVDPNGSNNSGGTPSAPKATLGGALLLAQANGATQIHMLGGSHPVSETASLVTGIDVVGGFARSGNTWSWGGSQTVIQHNGTPTAGRAIALSASSVATTVGTEVCFAGYCSP